MGSQWMSSRRPVATCLTRNSFGPFWDLIIGKIVYLDGVLLLYLMNFVIFTVKFINSVFCVCKICTFKHINHYFFKKLCCVEVRFSCPDTHRHSYSYILAQICSYFVFHINDFLNNSILKPIECAL